MLGRKPDWVMIKKLLSYHKKYKGKLANTEMARLLSTSKRKVDEKQVRRWKKYLGQNLSTGHLQPRTQ